MINDTGMGHTDDQVFIIKLTAFCALFMMSSSPIINVIHEEVILVRLFARAEICEATEERTVLKSACIAGGFLLHLRDPRLVFRRWWDVITQIDDVCFHLLHSPGIGIQPIIEGRGHGRLSFYRRVYFVCEKGATGDGCLKVKPSCPAVLLRSENAKIPAM